MAQEIDDTVKNIASLRDADNEGKGMENSSHATPSSSSHATTTESQYRAPIKHSKLRRNKGHDYAADLASSSARRINEAYRGFIPFLA